MPRIERILFPVDFSARCVQTAPAVAAWTRRFQAALTLLHVVPVAPAGAEDFSGELYSALQPAIRKAGEERLRAFAAAHFARIAPGLAVEEGSPGERVVAYAKKQRASLIMMPTHGHGTFRRLLTGSVTMKVLHDAAVPVWTSTHTTKAPPRAGKPRRILCAADLAEESVALIRWAAWLADRHEAELAIVHVMPAVDETSQNRGEKAVRRYWIARASAGMAAILKRAGRPGRELILRGGNLAAVLAETAGEQKADLLVIGRGRLTRKLGRLRTHTMAIICKSPCPVLSL